jgi:hypothetical protein
VHHHVLPPSDRSELEVHQNPLLGRPAEHFYTVFGYEHVREVLGNHEVFSSTQGPGPERLVAPNGIGMLLYADEPHHRLHRQIVNKAFTPRTVSTIEPRIREIVDEIVDGFIADGRVEIVRNFAVAIPGTVFSELLGVPPADTPKFKRWADELVAAFGGDAASQARSVVAMQEIASYFLAEFTRRRAVLADGGSLPDDLLTALLTSEVEGRYFDDVDSSAPRTPHPAPRTSTPRSPVARSPLVTRSASCSAPPTVTPAPGTTPTSSTSPATPAPCASTSDSGSASTAAWAPRWPAPNCGSPSRPCSTGSGRGAWTRTTPRCGAATSSSAPTPSSRSSGTYLAPPPRTDEEMR